MSVQRKTSITHSLSPRSLLPQSQTTPLPQVSTGQGKWQKGQKTNNYFSLDLKSVFSCLIRIFFTFQNKNRKVFPNFPIFLICGEWHLCRSKDSIHIRAISETGHIGDSTCHTAGLIQRPVHNVTQKQGLCVITKGGGECSLICRSQLLG